MKEEDNQKRKLWQFKDLLIYFYSYLNLYRYIFQFNKKLTHDLTFHRISTHMQFDMCMFLFYSFLQKNILKNINSNAILILCEAKEQSASHQKRIPNNRLKFKKERKKTTFFFNELLF